MAEQPALELTRTYTAAPERVFAAWTDPERLGKWFRPSDEMNVEVEADVKVGGRYRFKFVKPDGSEHVSHGEYEEIEPPERLVFTWTWESGTVTDSLVTVSLRAVEGGTELTLRHERLPSEELREHHGQGWIGCLAALEVYLG